MIVRADFGTENCVVAKAHIAQRMYHADAYAKEKSFIYGPSTANIVSHSCDMVSSEILWSLFQRIEALWSQWRRYVCDWWISA